jgi:hypothetical protein
MVSNTGKVSILHFPNLEAVCCIAFPSINSKQPATHQEFPPKIKYPDLIYMLNFIACFGPLPLIPTLDPQRSEWMTNYNFKGHKSLSKSLPSLQVKGFKGQGRPQSGTSPSPEHQGWVNVRKQKDGEGRPKSERDEALQMLKTEL